MVNWLRLRKMGQLVAVNTIAFSLFSMLTFFLPWFWEMTAKVTFLQSGQMRVVGIGLILIPKLMFGGMVVEILSDWFLTKLPSKLTNRWARATSHGLAVWLYQLVIYVLSSQLVDLSAKQVIVVQGIMFLESPLIGLLYITIQDETRSRLAPEKVNQP